MVPYGGWSVAWHKTNETNRRLATIPGVGAAKTKKESHKEQEKLLNRELEDRTRPSASWRWRGISRFTYCSLSATAQVCARARWSGSGLVISTGRRTSSASCRPRGAKTATSCCRQRRSICCGNGGRGDRLVTIRACRKRSAGCSLPPSQESR